MPILPNDYYQGVGTTLEGLNNLSNHKYMYSQSYTTTTTGNPFENLIPEDTNFWGPKVLTLQILSKVYPWNQTYIDAELNRFIEIYLNWERFEAKFWIDRVPANVVDAINANTEYNDLLDELETHLVATCNTMEDYNWVFMGNLTNQVSAEYFQEYIDAFYQ